MNKDLIQMIQSYPETYSAKEIVGLVWAEAGQIVSEKQVLEARQSLKSEKRTDLMNLLAIADRQQSRIRDPRSEISRKHRESRKLDGEKLAEFAATNGLVLMDDGSLAAPSVVPYLRARPVKK